MKLLPTLAAGALLAAAPAAQALPPPFFRNPSEDIQPPREAFDDLQVMRRLAREHGVHVDDDGREVCDDPAWQKAREALRDKMLNLGTFFGQILARSKHRDDRALSAYGTFYLDDPQDICLLITFFAEEPERAIREPAFRRSIDFLRVYLPRNAEVQGDDGKPAPPVPLYKLEVGPYLGLLSQPDPRDQAQGLWFLAQIMDIRNDSRRAILDRARALLPQLLLSDNADVREQARGFVLNADPEHRPPPAADAGDDQLRAWLTAVIEDVFPPIERVSDGLILLRESAELDQLVAVGRPALTTKPIGETDSDKLQSGQYVRGFRVQRLPEPLNKLGIPVGSVITTVNTTPVRTGRDILAALETALPAQHRVLVEFAYHGQTRFMEYRLAP